MGARVDGELDVAAPHHAQLADDLEGGGLQHAELRAAERLDGDHHDGVLRVDAAAEWRGRS